MRQRYVILNPQGAVEIAGSAPAGAVLPQGALNVVLARPVSVEVTPPDGGEPLATLVPWHPADETQIGISSRLVPSELGKTYRQGNLLVHRPLSPQPIGEPGQIRVPPCPAGTQIEIFDMIGGEVMATVIAEDDGFAEVFEFPDPGQYEVEVQAPFPALMTRAKVIV